MLDGPEDKREDQAIWIEEVGRDGIRFRPREHGGLKARQIVIEMKIASALHMTSCHPRACIYVPPGIIELREDRRAYRWTSSPFIFFELYDMKCP